MEKKWTFDEVSVTAASYDSCDEFKRNSREAWAAMIINKWYWDLIFTFDKKEWTFGEVQAEAMRYKDAKEFAGRYARRHSLAYLAALKNEWLPRLKFSDDIIKQVCN